MPVTELEYFERWAAGTRQSCPATAPGHCCLFRIEFWANIGTECTKSMVDC